MLGAFHGAGVALELYPTFSRGRLDAELFLDCLQIARIVIVELLGEPGVFKMEGFGWHW